MLDAADPPVLTAYMEKIESLARQFAPVCWALIYQAEARFRQDTLTQIQRQEIEHLEKAQVEGRTYKAYDPLRPWNRCFGLATEGQYALNNWHEHVEIKDIMILSAAPPQSEYLDGDCPIAPSSSAHIATYYSTPSDIGLAVESSTGRAAVGKTTTPPPNKRTRESDGGGAAKQPRKENPKAKDFIHNVTGGEYTINRSGNNLCKGFQTGQCTRMDCKFAHQCTKCLSPEHGGSECSKVAPAVHKKSKANAAGKKRA